MFHYCSLEKFEKILKSKKLWLTPVQTMTDSTEVDHLYSVIYPKVKGLIIQETPSNLLSNVETTFGHIENNSKLYVESMPYGACFSDEGDLLAQWREYADKGAGVSIGFSPDYFNLENEPPHPNIDLKNSIGLNAVIYDYNLQRFWCTKE